ncbi:MAG: hypothetical protein Q9184_005681 [Pyrenodesmia sp. 2 TL-2023]
MSGNHHRNQSQIREQYAFKAREYRAQLAEHPSLAQSTLIQPIPTRILRRPPVPESLRPGFQPNVNQDRGAAEQGIFLPPPPRHSIARPPTPAAVPEPVPSPNDTWAQRMRASKQLPEYHPTDTRWPGAPFIPTRGQPNPPLPPISRQPQAARNNLPPPLIPVRAQAASMPKTEPAAHVLPTVPLRQSDLPHFTRLDIPDEKGVSTTVGVNQQLIVNVNPSHATQLGPLATAPNEPLPNAQYNCFPMVLNLSGRDIALTKPYWDDRLGSTGRLNKPISGDTWYLSPREREQRQADRVRARHDLRRYGSPEWLALESESDED